MTNDICLYRLAYLLEKEHTSPETYIGYTKKGCGECDGHNIKCSVYISDNEVTIYTKTIILESGGKL